MLVDKTSTDIILQFKPKMWLPNLPGKVRVPSETHELNSVTKYASTREEQIRDKASNRW